MTAQVLLISSCGSLGRIADLSLPECPGDQVELSHGWVTGTAMIGEGVQGVWGMTVQDRKDYERWVQEWKTCGKARGRVIEEANQ